MDAIMPRPKAPDTSAQEARLAAQEKSVAARELESQQQAAGAQRARRGRAAARSSLITGGDETGVTRKTLG